MLLALFARVMAARFETVLTEPHLAPLSSGYDDPRDGARRSWREILQPFVVRHRRVATVATTLAIVVGAYVGAVLLRFDFTIPFDLEPIFAHTIVAVLVSKLVAFWAAGLFTGWWRHV